MVRARILYAVSFALTIALVVLYFDKEIALTALYALLLLLLFSALTVITAPFLIKVEQQVERDEIHKNEALVYTGKVVNKSLFYYPVTKCVFCNDDVFSYEGGPAEPGMMPRGSITREHTLQFPYRGIYALGIKSITITDFLGLFRWTFPVKNTVSVTVLPDTDEDFTLSLRDDSQNINNLRLFNEDYTDVADVRKYTASDSYKKIHWKLTAKRGELIVKNFQSKIQDKTFLFLDTRALPLAGLDKAAFEDKMVTLVASSVSYCVRSRLTSELIYGDALTDQVQIEPYNELGPIYRLLAGVPFANEVSRLRVFCDAIDRFNTSINMVLYLSDIDDEVFDTIRLLVSFDHNIIVYYCYSAQLPLTEEKDSFLERLKAFGVSVNKVEVVSTEN